MSKEEEIKQAMKNIKKIDILVNNAGIEYAGTIEETKVEEWDTTMNINLRGPYLMCKYALPLLKKSKGNIISIASILGISPYAAVPAYCVSKAALIMLIKCLAQDYETTKVRANAVLPGMTNTDLLSEAMTKSEIDISTKKVPMGRIGTPKEIANVVAFLASDEASYVNGSTYVVDGGHLNLHLF